MPLTKQLQVSQLAIKSCYARKVRIDNKQTALAHQFMNIGTQTTKVTLTKLGLLRIKRL